MDFNDLEANALELLEPKYGIADLLYKQLKEIMGLLTSMDMTVTAMRQRYLWAALYWRRQLIRTEMV